MEQRHEMRPPLGALLGLLFLGCVSSPAHVAEQVKQPPFIGTWVIVEQSSTPLVIIPLCKSIRKGTTVKFTQTTFEVYVDARETPCSTYAYRTSNNHISFSRADMVWRCDYEMTPNGLTLVSPTFFIPDETANPGAANQPPGTKQPVVITLKRQ